VPTRSTGDIIQFYYQHKPYADQLRCQDLLQGSTWPSEKNEAVSDHLLEEELHLPFADEPALGETYFSSSPSSASRLSSPLAGPPPPNQPPVNSLYHHLAPVYMPMGEDESDHEVDRKHLWLPMIGEDVGNESRHVGWNNRYKLAKRKREEVIPAIDKCMMVWEDERNVKRARKSEDDDRVTLLQESGHDRKASQLPSS